MSGNRPAGSLAAVEPGGRYTVRQILFEVLRGHCADLGVVEGTRVSCRAESTADVLIETPAGRVVPCGRDVARFVQVAPEIGGSLVVVVPVPGGEAAESDNQ